MNYNNLELITTVHNPESVVEVFFDRLNERIVEHKCLNYNRKKEYLYEVGAYLKNVKNFKKVDQKVLAYLRNYSNQ